MLGTCSILIKFLQHYGATKIGAFTLPVYNNYELPKGQTMNIGVKRPITVNSSQFKLWTVISVATYYHTVSTKSSFILR